MVVLIGTKHDDMAIWLPYWHLHHQKGKTITKYGQWAPFMGMDTYKELAEQAKIDGYI
jgi:hypothetical protein